MNERSPGWSLQYKNMSEGTWVLTYVESEKIRDSRYPKRMRILSYKTVYISGTIIHSTKTVDPLKIKVKFERGHESNNVFFHERSLYVYCTLT